MRKKLLNLNKNWTFFIPCQFFTLSLFKYNFWAFWFAQLSCILSFILKSFFSLVQAQIPKTELRHNLYVDSTLDNLMWYTVLVLKVNQIFILVFSFSQLSICLLMSSGTAVAQNVKNLELFFEWGAFSYIFHFVYTTWLWLNFLHMTFGIYILKYWCPIVKY